MPPRAAAPRLTHFLCLPLVTSTSRPQLQSSLAAFREAVTTSRTHDVPSGSIPAQAVRPLGTLHLTLGVMSLLSAERVESALKLLRELNVSELLAVATARSEGVGSAGAGKAKEESAFKKVEGKGKGKGKEQGDADPPVSDAAGAVAAGSEPKLHITLKGLASMHPPSQTSILYSAPVDPTGHLYTFCQTLRSIFAAADLLVQDTRPLLLHATIVNTVYVPGIRGSGSGSSGHGNGKSKSKVKLTIDATELLEDYEDYVWMRDVRLEKIALCRMGAKPNADGEEEYVVEGEVDVP